MSETKRLIVEFTNIWLVNLNHSPCDVRIDRTSLWGNPYQIGKDGSRSNVVRKYYRYYMKSNLDEHIEELRHQILGCHCYPKACHGDVLIWALYVKPIIDSLKRR